MAPVSFKPEGGLVGANNFAPQPQSKDNTKLIVKTELKRAKELEKLEEKHKNGEITDFEYRVNKAAINLKYDLMEETQTGRPPVMNYVA